MIDMNEIFQDLNQMVHEQGETIGEKNDHWDQIACAF